METLSTEPKLLEHGYISTIHWAYASDGYDSMITAYNYYGYAFPNEPREKTDADVTMHFFSEDGTLRTIVTKSLPTNESLYLSVSEVAPGFRGLVALRMVPRGKMPRLKDKSGRPIASSFFMLYKRQKNYLDFSHELFPVKFKSEDKIAEWSTVMYARNSMDPRVVVMNNRPGLKGQLFGSKVRVQLLDLASNPISEEKTFELQPGGSQLLELRKLFPECSALSSNVNSFLCCVRGNNIEQPMSLHQTQTGDFNIHHF